MPKCLLQAAKRSYGIDLQYPITRITGLVVNVGRYFFGITNDKNGNLKEATTIAVYFHLFQNSSHYEQVLKQWEFDAYEHMKSLNNTYVDLTLHGAHVVGKEVCYHLIALILYT